MTKYYKDNPEAKQKLLDGKGKNKPFDIFTTDGTFIKTFTYQYEAKEYLQNGGKLTAIKTKYALTKAQENALEGHE